MKVANIAEFKNNISKYIAAVEKGEEVEIRRRNIPVARVLPVASFARNRTRLGCGQGTATLNGDPTEPFMPEGDWNMLRLEDP